MSDKDMTERDVLIERPNAKLLICLFHTLRNMRRKMFASPIFKSFFTYDDWSLIGE